MELLTVLLGAAAGAVAGALASIATSTRISRGTELGRIQEEARQQMLGEVRLLRAHVSSALAEATHSSAMNYDYLSERSAESLSEQMERGCVHVRPGLAAVVRERVAGLVGPVQARIAREVASLPYGQRPHDWRVQQFYRLSGSGAFTPEQLEDDGLMGRARKARIIGEHVVDVVAELDRLEATLEGDAPRLMFPRRNR